MVKGSKHTEKAKRKISKALKGRPAWNKGKRMSEETRKKLSDLLRGKHRSPKTEFKKGQNRGSKNQAKRIEVRKKISDAKKGKPHLNQRGENHPNWKGGVTPKNERKRKRIGYKLWREAVFSRDNWTCQKCGQRGGKIAAHHLHSFAGFSELRISIKNGITLCKECHREFHKIYGLKKITKEKFEEFLNIVSHNQKKLKSEEVYSYLKT